MKRDWFAMVAGPLAWFVALVASWMVTPPAHESGSLAVLRAIDLGALVIAILAGAIASMRLHALSQESAADRHVQSARFVARSGIALSALSILLTIGLSLPTFLLVAGAEP